MIGDPETCRLQHRQIVRTVAHRNGFGKRQAKFGGYPHEGVAFRLFAQDGAQHAPGQFTLRDLQGVGVVAVKTQGLANARRVEGETTRYQHGQRAMTAHRLH